MYLNISYLFLFTIITATQTIKCFWSSKHFFSTSTDFTILPHVISISPRLFGFEPTVGVWVFQPQFIKWLTESLFPTHVTCLPCQRFVHFSQLSVLFFYSKMSFFIYYTKHFSQVIRVFKGYTFLPSLLCHHPNLGFT